MTELLTYPNVLCPLCRQTLPWNIGIDGEVVVQHYPAYPSNPHTSCPNAGKRFRAGHAASWFTMTPTPFEEIQEAA